MRRLRVVLWSAVAVALVAFAYLWFIGLPGGGKPWAVVAGVEMGGDFDLVRHDGGAISRDDILGRPHAIFFGFTHCPEVCPTTLFEMTDWLEELGGDADAMGYYFVTVDPERDTPELMADYLSAFDPRIVGITGEKEKVEEMLRAYRVYFNRVPLEDGDYTMDHTASVFLMDGEGQLLRTIAYGEAADMAVEKLRLTVQ